MFPKLPIPIRVILDTIHEAGGEGYVVGGAVRDLLQGKVPTDWDLSATLPKEALLAAFQGAKDKGGRFGTVSVPCIQGDCDITPCRSESDYQDHRHPETVQFHGNILLDLLRRDFTVNAMAYNGEILIDPFDGQGDLQKGVLRCVGEPRERYSEDPLRILRLFRISATKGFKAELNTLNAALEKADEISLLSHERVYKEVLKILMSSGPQALGPLITKGAFSNYGFAYAPSLAALSRVPQDPLCRWWALMTLCGADPDVVSEAFCFNSYYRRELSECTRLYRAGPAKNRTELKRKLRNTKLDYGPISASFAAISPYYVMEPVLYERILVWQEPYRIEDLAVDGQLLEFEGISGEMCGKVLNELLSAVIKNPSLNRTSVLLGLARGLRQMM
ncbi:CCA tRNA nucleotidyltransferase [Ruminococcaceae bacterium OttesenSCG-928-I18]|nr:CCA tRNA nucleotidyltransferase [Ruminococcaceae bacterium OttesenSCG-928-I18]